MSGEKISRVSGVVWLPQASLRGASENLSLGPLASSHGAPAELGMNLTLDGPRLNLPITANYRPKDASTSNYMSFALEYSNFADNIVAGHGCCPGCGYNLGRLVTDNHNFLLG